MLSLRLLALYSRSRQVPAALACSALGAFGAWAIGSSDPRILSVAVGLGVAAAAGGLSGADVQLDRTASLPWPSRRFLHLLAIVLVITGLLLATDLGTAGLILRDTAGLTGLAALGAAVAGSQLAWVAPMTWTAVTAVFPVDNEILMWMLQPPGSQAALLTAAGLGVLGSGCYVVLGPRS